MLVLVSLPLGRLFLVCTTAFEVLLYFHLVTISFAIVPRTCAFGIPVPRE
jgi:hypothetical protein